MSEPQGPRTFWISPDCANGKHHACAGTAMDDKADEVTTCGCCQVEHRHVITVPATHQILACEVCHAEPAVGVIAVPAVAYSAAYGIGCITANAHPWNVIVGHTGLVLDGFVTSSTVQGVEEAYNDLLAEEWKAMVTATITHLGKTQREFYAQVADVIHELTHAEDFADMEDS